MKFSPYQIAEILGQPAPTAQQAEVIAAPLEPLLVVAGAGSGKTETMAARVVYLVANELVRPEAVLGLTFTRKAAGELLERIQKRLNQLSHKLNIVIDVTNRPTVATYNSFAQQIVRENGLWVGIEPSATLLSEASAWQHMFRIVSEHDGELLTERTINTVTKEVLGLENQLNEHLVQPINLNIYLSDLSNNITSLPWGLKKKNSPPEVRELTDSLELRRQYLGLIDKFRRHKQELNVLTFGDQIAYAAELATAVPAVGQAVKEQYQVVLLDEYQDTSHAQVQFLSGLFGGGHPVTAVGDPNQAIYGWRGASASGLARFPEEFRRSDGQPAKVLPLATAWRNDQAILTSANQVAEPLRTQSTHVQVPELGLSPFAQAGNVSATVVNTVSDEAEVVADWIASHWTTTNNAGAGEEKIEQNPVANHNKGGAGGTQVTAAVLCRTRKQFGSIAEALGNRGIPYEIVGLGGLLDAPAVVDLIAALQATADPSRGDWLLRLLTGQRVNLGAADLQALGSWAGDIAKRQLRTWQRAITDGKAGFFAMDDAEARSIIDALDNLPAPGQAAHDGRLLSEAGRHRLEKLANSIRNIRQHSYLSLPEICLIGERELGLDIELSVNMSGRGRADLDSFRDVAANYAKTVPHPTLPGFLGWLETAQERERGLDLPLVEVDSQAVQLITIHAAKGLEWDIVAVPGLVEGNFPSGNVSSARNPDGSPVRLHRAWLTDNASLPYALRGDKADLPTITWSETDQTEVATQIIQLKADSGAHELASERRLAYVAFTRARHEMLLTGYWWGSQTRPRQVSTFLSELVEAGLVSDLDWTQPPAEEQENPLLQESATAIWPLPPTDYEMRIREQATQVKSALSDLGSMPDGNAELRNLAEKAASPEIKNLADLANILLAEREGEPPDEVAFPAQVSASALVRLASDRAEFATQLRRPIPMKPTVQAQTGTQFHEWVQQHFEGVGYLFDEDQLLGDLVADTDWDGESVSGVSAPGVSSDAEIEDFKETFLNSEWAGLTPIAIEQEINFPVAGVPVIARIDAVFSDPQNPGSDLVVDWKTGKPATSSKERQAREVQLAVYRLGWAKLSGKPLDQISAAFHYVGTGQTVRPQQLLSEEELEMLIKGQ